MKTLSVRIDDEIKRRLDELTAKHGINRSHVVREALVEKLEELEDFYVARERLGKPYKSVTHEKLMKDAGLAD